MRCAGICGTRSGFAMSKNCSPSVVWRRITRRSGVGYSVTVPNWNSDCAAISSRRTKSWCVDETYVRVQVLSLSRHRFHRRATIDFLLSTLRDAAAAQRLFRQALKDASHPQPRVINTDKARLYGSAIAAVKKEGTLRRRCRHRPVQDPGAGPPRDQTPREGQARLSRVPRRAANDCWIRGDAHDPQGAGALGRRRSCSPTE